MLLLLLLLLLLLSVLLFIIIFLKQRVGASLSKVASEVQLCTALILNGSMD